MLVPKKLKFLTEISSGSLQRGISLGEFYYNPNCLEKYWNQQSVRDMCVCFIYIFIYIMKFDLSRD